MEDTYFKIDEDFETIIKDTLVDKRITKLNFISTGWTNIVYEVETNEGNYFFRFPRDDFWARTIVKDYEFAKYIHNKTDFNTVQLQLHFNNGRPYSVHKKIEGMPLANKIDKMSKKEMEQCGKDIAKFIYDMNNIEYNKQEIFNKADNIGTDLKDFLNELLTVHVSNEDMEFWKDSQIRNDEKGKKLVHGDLNLSNVLIDENNKLTAVIDFGFAGFGNKYDDLSRIMSRTCPLDFKEGIIKGYQEYSNKELNMKILDNKIHDWKKIDNSYINYMRTIGIYE